jgi:hypothetical protein
MDININYIDMHNDRKFYRLQRETLKRISWSRYYQRMIAPSPGRTVSSPWKD